MAYAAYKEFSLPATASRTPVYQVLRITVPIADAHGVRRALRACHGVGILRCEPLPHAGAACATSAPQARFTLHLAPSGVDEVWRCLLRCTQDGELGSLTSWREHLRRLGLPHGGSSEVHPLKK